MPITKKRNVYTFNVGAGWIYDLLGGRERAIYEELKKVLNYIYGLDLINRKKDIPKENKIILLKELEEEDVNGFKFLKVSFISAKYNHVREVINKDTLENKGRMKERTDGDVELNHVCFMSDNRTVTATFEYNSYGIVNFSKIIAYINEFIREYFESINQVQYMTGFDSDNIVSRDFLEELRTINIITSGKIILSKVDLDATGFARFSGQDEIREEVEVCFNRDKRTSNISKEFIEELYRQVDGNNGRIKKLYVHGYEGNSKVRLNTEEMKERIELTVNVNEYDEVDSDDIWLKMRNYLLG